MAHRTIAFAVAVSLAQTAWAQAPATDVSEAEKRAAAAVVAAEECGGTPTPIMQQAITLAAEQGRTGKIKAASMRYRMMWSEVSSSDAQKYALCARAFENGWIE